MNQVWRECRLGDVSDIRYGYTAKASADIAGPKFLRITDIQNDAVNWPTVPSCPITSEDLEKHRLEEGDIVFARTGATTGKSCRLIDAPEAVAASYLIRVRITEKGLTSAFLELFFKSAEYWTQVKAGTIGSAQGGFNASKLAELKIPVPPPEEQKRIVAILDEAFAGIETAIANTEKNLANARELFESYLNTALCSQDGSWERVCLSDVCSITSGLVDPRDPKYADLPHVGAGNMASRTGQLSNVLTAREEGLKSGKYLFDKSMVLYSKIRPYLEKVARPNMSGLCSADVYPLSPSSERLARGFLFYMLLSKTFTDYAIAGSSRAGMPKVNREHLFQYAAALPSLDEQERIVSALDEIAAESQRLELIFEQKLAAFAELKQSLLQKAFSGELTADRAQEELESATA